MPSLLVNRTAVVSVGIIFNIILRHDHCHLDVWFIVHQGSLDAWKFLHLPQNNIYFAMKNC